MPNCKPPALTNDFYLTHEVVRGLFELYMASVVPTGLQSSRMRRSLKGYAFAEQAISATREPSLCVFVCECTLQADWRRIIVITIALAEYSHTFEKTK